MITIGWGMPSATTVRNLKGFQARWKRGELLQSAEAVEPPWCHPECPSRGRALYPQAAAFGSATLNFLVQGIFLRRGIRTTAPYNETT